MVVVECVIWHRPLYDQLCNITKTFLYSVEIVFKLEVCAWHVIGKGIQIMAEVA